MYFYCPPLSEYVLTISYFDTEENWAATTEHYKNLKVNEEIMEDGMIKKSYVVWANGETLTASFQRPSNMMDVYFDEENVDVHYPEELEIPEM